MLSLGERILECIGRNRHEPLRLVSGIIRHKLIVCLRIPVMLSGRKNSRERIENIRSRRYPSTIHTGTARTVGLKLVKQFSMLSLRHQCILNR